MWFMQHLAFWLMILGFLWWLGGPARWIPYLVLTLFLYVIGLPLIYIQAKLDAYTRRKSVLYADREILVWRNAWMWIWGNEENGIDAMSPTDQLNSQYQGWYRVFYWCAIRNPQDNLKYVGGINPRIKPALVKYWGNCMDVDYNATRNPHGFYWTYTTQRGFAGLHMYWRDHIYRIGWKLVPMDAHRPPSRIPVGFALQRRHET